MSYASELQAQFEPLHKHLRDSKDEIERLRKALESIRDLKWVGENTHSQMRQIARTALERGKASGLPDDR